MLALRSSHLFEAMMTLAQKKWILGGIGFNPIERQLTADQEDEQCGSRIQRLDFERLPCLSLLHIRKDGQKGLHKLQRPHCAADTCIKRATWTRCRCSNQADPAGGFPGPWRVRGSAYRYDSTGILETGSSYYFISERYKGNSPFAHRHA